MFYIRADGNTQIGAGHIMRCISIAQALKNRGKVTIFITADEESTRLISSKGFGTLTLKTQYNDMEGELDILLPILAENEIQTLLIDSYSVTDDYMRKVGEKVKTVYMDDLGEHLYPADMIINYNIYAKELEYEENYQKKVMKIPKLLLGCDYAPLRSEFQGMEGKARRSVRDILITTGGSDPANAAGQILEVLIQQGAKYRGIQFHIVSGTYNTNIEGLRDMEKENANFHVYQNIKDMAELMKKCDVAIAACGSTMYELSAMGIPTVCYYFADNQKKVAEAFGRTLASNAGNITEESEKVLHQILDYLDAYIDSYELRIEKSDAMIRMLDGDGASRIAEEIIKMRAK